jgi:hypothetical protein
LSAAARLLNAAWLGANAPGYLRFRAALRDPRAAQESLLRSTLRSNRRTAFGAAHRFEDIRSGREYQQRVPLSDYDDYKDSLERISSGDQGVLTAAPVRLLEPTGGSTRGPKLIPYTARLQAEIRRAVAPWIFDLARTRPGLMGGPAYWSLSPAVDLPLAQHSKLPIGFETDSAYLGGWFRGLVNRTLIDCASLRNISDVAEFRRQTLARLLSARDLRLISVWHPTFLTTLLETLAESWHELLSALHQGEAGAARVRELERADPHRPMTIWPELQLISCWGDGQAASLLPDLEERFPGVKIQPKGLIATEAFVSLPFEDQCPLAVRSHFFEFIGDDGSAKFAWQLEESRCYSVVVTTGGGLYRYRLRDRIQVTGFLAATPSIRFIGKEDGISDLYGEKLSECFVAHIVRELLQDFAPSTHFYLLAPERTGAGVRYVLFLDAPVARRATMAERLESALRANPHYAYCVHLEQLQPAAIAEVPRGSERIYLSKLHCDGKRLGNIKPMALSSATDWRSRFLGTAPDTGSRL